MHLLLCGLSSCHFPVTSCSDRSVAENGVCVGCPANCTACWSSTNCTTCSQGLNLIGNGTCGEACGCAKVDACYLGWAARKRTHFACAPGVRAMHNVSQQGLSQNRCRPSSHAAESAELTARAPASLRPLPPPQLPHPPVRRWPRGTAARGAPEGSNIAPVPWRCSTLAPPTAG